MLDNLKHFKGLEELQVQQRFLIITHCHVLENLVLRALGTQLVTVRNSISTGGQKGLNTHANGGL